MSRGDMKDARKQCDKVLSKQANHAGALAMKAYTLARLGDVDEAVEIGQKLLQAPDALKSPHVQQGLSLMFRVLNMAKEEIAVHTAALKYTTNAEQLHCKIFMAAARNKLYKEQHAAAVSLNKSYKQDHRYLWWVVISLLLQAKFVDEGSSVKALQLTLAERMAEKALSEGRLTNTEELRIYLDVLEIQGKYDAMLAALSISGPLAEKIANDPDLVTRRIELLIKTGDFAKALDAAEQTLESRDNWADYKLYVEAIVAFTRATKDDDTPIRAASANFDKWAAQRGRARGARLADVELATKLREAGHSMLIDETTDVVGERIWSYVDQFMNKAICYSDIAQYFVAHANSSGQSPSAIEFHTKQLQQRLCDARAMVVTSQPKDNVDGIATNGERGEDAGQAWVSLERIRYLLQALSDDVDPNSWVTGIDVMVAFGLDSDEAEQKLAACSDMTLIVSQRIIQAAFLAHSEEPSQRDKLCSALFKAICVLEAGIKMNDDQFLLKLYAIRLYLYLSCYDRARAIYDKLSIKNIQLDTLGHFVNGHGMALGCFAADLDLCYDGVAFYDRAETKVPRELESAYEKGTYSNITDFLAFDDNLAHSMQRECTHRCALRGEAFEHGTTKAVLDQWKEADVVSIEHTDASIAALHDNRDVSVMGLQTPVDMTKWNLEIMTRSTPLLGPSWIQVFSMVPQIMHYVICADIELLESRTKDLLVAIDEAGQSMSSFDLLLARGVYQAAILYLRAQSGSEVFSQELTVLTDMIIGALPQDTSSPPSSVATLQARAPADLSLTIRSAAAATELFTYAQSVRFALAAQKSPSAKAIALELGQVRKTALTLMSSLRALAERPVRESIFEQWTNDDSSGEDSLLASATTFLSTRRKSALTVTAKSCASSWLKSVNNMTAHWKKCA
ncbi:mitochondrial distribution and morphology [Coemansia aciculifera]|nr:mitochondrial distribution and morphology [Coemansia aciculifera]